MKKSIFSVVLAIAGLVVFTAPEFVRGMSHDDLTKGDRLLEYITEESDYRNWKLWPGKAKFYEGTSPHGKLLTTYVNDKAVEPIRDNMDEVPYGSIIVKENYKPNKQLAAVTVMYKKKGYDPHHGDWFYFKYAPDKTIQAKGKVESCMKCHSDVSDTDWLFLLGS